MPVLLSQESASPVRSASARAAAVMDLFSHVDVHGESSVTWEDVSNYFIEQGMSGSTAVSALRMEPRSLLVKKPFAPFASKSSAFFAPGGDEFTVDSIKTYEVSQVKDVSKHAARQRGSVQQVLCFQTPGDAGGETGLLGADRFLGLLGCSEMRTGLNRNS